MITFFWGGVCVNSCEEAQKVTQAKDTQQGDQRTGNTDGRE